MLTFLQTSESSVAGELYLVKTLVWSIYSSNEEEEWVKNVPCLCNLIRIASDF